MCANVCVYIYVLVGVEAVVGVAGAGSCEFIPHSSFCSSETKWNSVEINQEEHREFSQFKMPVFINSKPYNE